MTDITTDQKDFENLVPDRPSPGEMLRLARERCNLSHKDVAQQLKLRVQWILDIENDEYQDAAALIYVKGYLKSYARLVELSNEKVLEAFKAMQFEENFIKEKATVPMVGQQIKQQPILSCRKTGGKRYKSSNWFSWALTGVVLLAIVLAVMWFRGQPIVTHSSAPHVTLSQRASGAAAVKESSAGRESAQH